MAGTAVGARAFWDDKFWDRSVHRVFTEELIFFLLKIKPFRHRDIVRGLNRIIQDLKLGSVHAFKILGPYDLLIRAWLHPEIESQFTERLHQLPHFQKQYEFRVQSFDSLWFSADGPARENPLRDQLIAVLDRKRIEAIESGHDPSVYQRYRACELVVERPPLDNRITFFVGVNFKNEPPDDSMATICRTMRNYIESSLPGVQLLVIDRGKGMFQILIKGETADFFEIGELPAWISETFHTNGPETETYLSHGRQPIAGDGRLSVGTLDWLGGADPWVRFIVPDLYPKRGERLREEIERFLKDHRSQVNTNDDGQRLFLKDFLSGVLDPKSDDSSKALYVLFRELEKFLAGHYREFLGREGLDLNTLMAVCHVNEPARPTLMDLLQIYTHAVRSKGTELNPSGVNPSGERTEGWNALVQLRNDSFHANYDPLEKWQGIVQTLLGYWVHVLKLTTLICQKCANAKFEATYWR